MRLLDDRPDSIAAQLARRDAQGIYSDWAYVVIDSYLDRRTAFAFWINPRGVKRDVFHHGDTREDPSWDAVWEATARVDSAGWTAEFRIPLSQLRFDPKKQAWGINFGREIARREEKSFWSPVRPDAPGFVSEFGDLTGLASLAPPRRLELQPYSMGRLTRAPSRDEDPFFSRNDLSTAVGADVRYGISSDFTVTATFNPDFGQVEADPAVVNLTAFETFFSERRPFFAEGTDIFRFGLEGGGELFYSRRIGRAPQASAPGDARFLDVPEATTILGAAKLSGKTSSGWSVGVLNALTAPEEARYVAADLRELRAPVEPLTNYGVGRVIKDFRRGRSNLGAILTTTHRDFENGHFPLLRSSAYSGGVDGQHRFGSGNYRITGYLLGSYLRGSEGAITAVQRAPGHYFQRPDAEHLALDPNRTTLGGWTSSLHLDKIGGAWRWGAHSDLRSPGMELNDLGFQNEADVGSGRVYIGYLDFTPGKVFRNWSLFSNNSAAWTFGGERVSTSANVNGSFQFRNNWGGGGDITRTFSALSTTALRGGRGIRVPGETRTFLTFYTDRRRILSGTLTINGALEDDTDGHYLSVAPRVDYRPSPRMSLSLGPVVFWNRAAWQYIAQRPVGDSTHYFFGRLNQTTTSLTARLNYTFSPNLSLQFYAQPFIGAGEYGRFMEVDDPRAREFEGRFRLLSAEEVVLDPGQGRYNIDLDRDGVFDASFRNPSFSRRQFRSNAVLRWEYRPGSTLFVAWNQGRQNSVSDGRFALWDDVREIFGSPGTNVLLIKVSYWLGL
jgi:hypothetical protein